MPLPNPLIELTTEEKKAIARQTAQQVIGATRQMVRNLFTQARAIRNMLANPDADPATLAEALGTDAENVESVLVKIEEFDPAKAQPAA